MVNEKLKQLGLPELYSKEDKISKKYSQKELESMLLQIAKRNLQIMKLISGVYKKSDIKSVVEEKPTEVQESKNLS